MLNINCSCWYSTYAKTLVTYFGSVLGFLFELSLAQFFRLRALLKLRRFSGPLIFTKAQRGWTCGLFSEELPAINASTMIHVHGA